MTENYPKETELLMPLIIEYKTNGTTGSLSWDPIPDKAMTNPIYSRDNGCDCSERCDENGETETKQYEFDERNCTVRQKIVLFVMKVLGFK